MAYAVAFIIISFTRQGLFDIAVATATYSSASGYFLLISHRHGSFLKFYRKRAHHQTFQFAILIIFTQLVEILPVFIIVARDGECRYGLLITAASLIRYSHTFRAYH